jgi:nitrous oxidase accessory protein
MRKYFCTVCLFIHLLSLGANPAKKSFAALYASTPAGQHLFLKKGIYTLQNFIINKPIFIEGEPGTIIDGENKAEILLIQAPHVTLKNLEIRNSGKSYMNDFAAIRVSKTHHFCIENCKIINTFFGIYLSEVDSSKVENNIIAGETNVGNCGDGIHLWYSDYIQLNHNRISKHRDGMYFEFAKRSHIVNNYTELNQRYGLHFMFSDDDTFLKNTFIKNGTGVAVMYSKNINMLQNRFEENWGGSTYGMLCKDITDSKIHHNIYIKNTTAIYMEGSSRLLVDSNEFRNNGWAVKLMASCENVSFEQNNFKQNSFDLSTNGSLFLNHLNKNYWEKYNGYDLNKDKIGDVPYRPVSLYNIMVEQMPFVIMLMRSLIIELLDTAERSIPSLTPENIKDEKPLMQELILDDRAQKPS